MKKNCFYFSAILFFSVLSIYSAKAQLYFGLESGVGVSSYKEFNGINSNIGICFEHRLWKTTHLHIGIGKNDRYVGGLLSIDYEGPQWNVDQYYMPVTLKFIADNQKKAKPYFKVGGSYGTLADPKYFEYAGYGESPENIGFKKSELDLILGAGLNFSFKHGFYFMEIRHRRGLNDLTDKKDQDDLKINSTDLLHIGIAFDLSE